MTSGPPSGGPDPTFKEAIMRGRIVLFVVLAVVLALAGVYVGWSTNTPKAVGEQATPADVSVSSPQRRDSGSGPARSPTGSPKGSAGHGSSSKDSAPNSAPKKGANHAGTTTPSGNTSAQPSASEPQHRAGPVRFGPVTTSGLSSVTDIAGDRRALTTTFSDFEVTVDGASAEPVYTKTFSMTVPLTDGAEGETLRVHASGFTILEEGAKARIALKGGGQQLLKGFATGSDEEYVETLELRARPGVIYQLSFAIEINRGVGPAGNGFLNMVAIDIEIT
jgi:hypothetical protein